MSLDAWAALIIAVSVFVYMELTNRRIRALERDVLNLRALQQPDPARMAANRRRIMERIAEE